jgi:hypothetical protein
MSMYGPSALKHRVPLRRGLSYISGLTRKAAPRDSDLTIFGIHLSSRAAFYEFCSDTT